MVKSRKKMVDDVKVRCFFLFGCVLVSSRCCLRVDGWEVQICVVHKVDKDCSHLWRHFLRDAIGVCEVDR